MSGVGVGFVGGPMDGREEWINADLMEPPRFIEFTAISWKAANDLSRPLPPVVQHRYVREPNGRDEGPLWLYRWAGEQR